MPDDPRDPQPPRPRVLRAGAIPPATNRARRDVRANDAPVAAPPLGSRETELDPVPLARGVSIDDSRRFVGYQPGTRHKVFENLAVVVVDHHAFGNDDAKAAFPRYGAFVYDSEFGTFDSFFHDDRQRCLDFARARGVIGGEKENHRGRVEGGVVRNLPQESYVASIACASGAAILLEGPRPVPEDNRTAFLMGDALMKHRPLLLEAMRAGYLRRTFGRSGPVLPTAVAIQGIAGFSPERLAATRFCLALTGADVWCAAAEAGAVEAGLLRAKGSAKRLPAQADPSGPFNAAVLDGAATGWCHTAPDQDRWLRALASGAQAATVERAISLDAALATVLAGFVLLPTKPGAPRQAVVLVPVPVASEVAGRDHRGTRTYRSSDEVLALTRLKDAVARCPPQDDVARFNRFDVARIEPWLRGHAWMVDAVAEANADGKAHVWAILDIVGASRLVRRLSHEEARKVIAGLRALSGNDQAVA